jgi:hypothetical protein
MMALEFNQYYAISIAAIWALLAIYSIGSIISTCLYYQVRYFLLRFLLNNLLLRRRYWGSVTFLQGILIGFYIGGNGYAMWAGWKDLISRSGLLASINLVPLFLGGRTNLLAEFLGVSLQSYYLMHHWVGRVAILQGLVHALLVIRRIDKWNFDTYQISGITVRLNSNSQNCLLTNYRWPHH